MLSERVQVAVVAVFLLVVAGAVVFLLGLRDTDAGDSAAKPAGGPDDPRSAEAGPTGAASFQVGKKNLLLRVRAGSCTQAGGPKLEISGDLGRTFRTVRPPQIDDGGGVGASSPRVRAIVRAAAASGRKITVLAADTRCVVSSFTTSDGGESWTRKKAAEDVWYLDPKTGGVMAPGGPADPGCDKAGLLAPVDGDTARVFCPDGTIRSTGNGGASWDDVGTLDDVTSAVFTGPRTGYATVQEDGCASRVYATGDGGATWAPTGCVTEKLAIPALAVVDGHLVAGGTGGTLVSDDDGKTWDVPAGESVSR